MQRAALLDRDGVINAMWHEPEHGLVDSPLSPDQFQLLPGVGKAIAFLKQAGFLAVVVSNQPTVAKGKCTLRLLDAVTEKMKGDLKKDGAELDAIYYCLHHPDATVDEYRSECECRKPRPGLLLRASEEFGIDLCRSYMIGDGLSDVEAGNRAGCKTIWIGKRKCEVCQVAMEEKIRPYAMASSLTEAAEIVIREDRASGNFY